MATDTSDAPGRSGGLAPVVDLAPHRRPDARTLLAFAAVVLLLAANPLVVRFTDRALAPFWNGATRMLAASIVFFAYVAVRRIAMPRGRELGGAIAYGAVQFGVGFGLGYWGLQKVPANVVGVLLASIPLFTIVFAATARVERMTLRGLIGALVSLGGIAVLLGARPGGQIPTPYLAASLGFAACLAAALVIAKSLRAVNPASLNAIGMLTGGALLLAASFAAGEPRPLPALTATWAVQLYVVLLGSVGAFGLMLYVLRRWTASATSYQTVLSPPVTIALAALLLGEQVNAGMLVGTAIVLVGVYVGVISHWHWPHARPPQPVPADKR